MISAVPDFHFIGPAFIVESRGVIRALLIVVLPFFDALLVFTLSVPDILSNLLGDSIVRTLANLIHVLLLHSARIVEVVPGL